MAKVPPDQPTLRALREALSRQETIASTTVYRLIRLFEETDLDNPITLTGVDRSIVFTALKNERHRRTMQVLRAVQKKIRKDKT